MDDTALGLTRVVVTTAVGPVVARVGAADTEEGLLLVHGAAGSWRAWIPMLREAARTGCRPGRVVAVDLPGWGESPDPRHPLDAAVAADAVVAVARAAGVARWSVIGHSLGGAVALEIAVRTPDETERVVLVSPTGPAVLDAIRRPVAGGFRLPWFAGMLLAMRVLAALPGGGRPLLRALSRSGVLGVLAAPLFADRTAVDAQVLHDLGGETRPVAFVRAARTAARTGLPSGVVRCPVRSVRGARDVFVGAEDGAELARRLPDFQEVVVPGAGHFALAERPAAVLAALER